MKHKQTALEATSILVQDGTVRVNDRSGGESTINAGAPRTFEHSIESSPATDPAVRAIVEGRLLIDLEGRTIELEPRQGFVVPKGLLHRTRALERTVILMVENAGITPTGS